MTLTGKVTKAAERGPRTYQEDYALIHCIANGRFAGWLLAIMDGHGGAQTAQYCRDNLTPLFEQAILMEAISPEEILRFLVSSLNEQTREFDPGTTISLCLILEEEDAAYIAILGDSPVLVVDGFGELHKSPEHNARTNMSDRLEAMQRGARYSGGYLETPYGHSLQLSRALGDMLFDSFLNREPEVYSVKEPRFIAVCSDGVLDPGHSKTLELADELGELLKQASSAEDILEWAGARRLADNATAILWTTKE